MILGLDINTKIIGYSILDNDQLIDFGIINISKLSDIFDKLSFVKDILFSLKDKYSITKIATEDFLAKFAAGRSRISTIIVLAQINSLINYECFNVFNIKPELINVLKARKLILGKSWSKEYVNSKEFVFLNIIKIFDI